MLVNWPSTKYVICNDNHNFPVKIPSHPYALLRRSVLCNCVIEADILMGIHSSMPRKTFSFDYVLHSQQSIHELF